MMLDPRRRERGWVFSDAAPAGAQKVVVTIANGTGSTKQLRILLAEDEGLIALFLEQLLGAMGHEVCAIVASEAAAVKAAAQWMPDLLIMDVHLEEGNGVAAVAEILRTGFLPHIFVTGDLYRLGADPGAIVIQKPFDVPQLVRAIDRALAVNGW